ncbi:hypothetical protein G5C33_01985 [Sphingosinithalassobacter tenebrarum]|uniref:Uncharacterized protein n=2 Tax=Stakelama tenebrarum TaxID=2711215 RepID=A0A6G6Y1J1_9SPHN|nr:hypothetical protein G5C33_01985 [Sphingosinithalassobacter tenebrarum]
MVRKPVLLLVLALMGAGCTSVEHRTARFAPLSCAQLETALDYETRAERSARRNGVVAGVASIFESGSEEDVLELDSDMSFLEADDRRLSVRAIRAEQQRRCPTSFDTAEAMR